MTCPGELYCLSKTPDDSEMDADTKEKLESVKINGIRGRSRNRTLGNYCHNKKPNLENRLLEGCPLYATKPDLIDVQLSVAIEVAEFFRELKNLDLLPKLEEMNCYEFTCYKSAQRATDIFQNKKMKETENQSQNQSKANIGDKTAIRW